ncbi:MAG: hypothetical protein MSB08_06070 [Subdoligranulum sp.]|nr:hypothetical protein [Subdoligranulum sp.]
MKNVLDRFLEYVSVETTSNEASTNYPSTPGQLELGRRLVKELLEIGLSDAAQDEYGSVTATIPANRKGGPVLGLVTHLDTSNAVSGANIRPRLVKYQGGDIALNESITMKVEDFLYLENFIGKTLIVTDGTTLLGADDKSGVAEIITLAERLSLAGLPCPNLSTGGANYHSRYEFIPLEDMECMVDVLTELASQLAGKEKV